jgi:zinc protease
MKTSLPALLWVLAAAACAGPGSTATAPAGPAIIALPAPGHPAVALRLYFRSGSVDDPPGKEGLTALTARLMAEGGTKSLSSAELIRALYPLATEIRVLSEKETTVFHARASRADADKLVAVLTEAMVAPRFDPQELERLRAEQRDRVEKHLRNEDDEELGKEALSSMLYGGHPYRHPVAGTVKGLAAITLDDVKAQARRAFTRARLTIGVAGGYEDGLPDRVLSALAPLPAGEPARPPPPVPNAGPKYLLVEKAGQPTAISLGYPWELDRRHPDFPAVYLAVSAIGQHRAGAPFRLFQELREVRGLNYGDYAYAEHFREGPSMMPEVNVARTRQDFTVWIRPVEPQHKAFALRAALEQVDKLVSGGLTADELERTRKFLLGWTLQLAETDSRRLGFALDDRFYGLPRPFLDELRDALGKLTLAEVNAAVKKWIDPKKLRVAIATHDAAALKAQLVAGTPSPIVYSVKKPPAVLDEDKIIERFPLGIASETEVRVVPVEKMFEE